MNQYRDIRYDTIYRAIANDKCNLVKILQSVNNILQNAHKQQQVDS